MKEQTQKDEFYIPHENLSICNPPCMACEEEENQESSLQQPSSTST